MPPIGRWTLVQAACTELLAEKSVMLVLSVVWFSGETEEPGAVEAERARLPTATKGGGVPAIPTFARWQRSSRG
jgi:hypothetical protein